MPETAHRRTAIEIPWKTLFKILAAVVLVWLWLKLYQTVLLVIVAIILAVTLEPIVAWLARRMSRGAATALVTGTLLLLIGGFLWLTWSSLSAQASYAVKHFQALEQQAEAKLPGWMSQSIAASANGDLPSLAGRLALVTAQSVTSAIVVGVLGFILTIYLLTEGRQTRDWVVAFVPRAHRAKMEATLSACKDAVVGYMAGNVATSICAFVFALVTLSVLKVPAALLLAVCAGVFDFIPVLGLILSSGPAIIMAATVSGKTALIVALLYAAYHTIENYVIAPYVYGDRLKLSNVVVILAFAVGAELAGVIGALIALPIAAVYPAVERIWLRDHLAEDTVREHRAIEKRAV
jgi:putative heme transporter